jgi:hypothetical protein
VKEINDETITQFIQEELDVQDFGYLIVPEDARLNAEALANIKNKFRVFIGSDAVEKTSCNDEDDSLLGTGIDILKNLARGDTLICAIENNKRLK